MQELGRLRELTFQRAGEGTGKELDLDSFDPYYTHVILWHKKTAAIAGSYRLAWTDDVLTSKGIEGLYTSTLFRFEPAFFERIGSAVELGRSFVQPDFQRDFSPLLLLWQAISRCVCKRPGTPVLFGAVSISARYSDVSRELIVQFLKDRCFRTDLAPLVVPRRRFRSHLLHEREMKAIIESIANVDDLPIGDIGNQDGVPVLLRQYLRLGGRALGFNVDRSFSEALDGLILVDLRETPAKLLSRYMGAEAYEQFRRQWSLAEAGRTN